MRQRPTPPSAHAAVCARCYRVFNSVTAFDKHQIQGATTECRDPAALGMVILRQHHGHDVWATEHRHHIPQRDTQHRDAA